jgi:hypothetical protein
VEGAGDATHDPIHGEQEGRHFNAFNDCYCCLSLYIFAGRHLLAAKLRSADKDAADGASDEVARIVAQIREGWRMSASACALSDDDARQL